MSRLNAHDEAAVPPWLPLDTERWLTNYPLPATFLWPDNYGKERLVLPTNRISKGYGFWLRTTPYFPGLFELCHRIIATTPADFPMTPEWLAGRLDEYRPRGTQGELL